MSATTDREYLAAITLQGTLVPATIEAGIITTNSLRADRVLHTWRTCRVCSMPIRIMIFRGTGVCSERCSKAAS